MSSLVLIILGGTNFLCTRFACPCESKQNVRLVVLFFIGPALLAFVLMIKIQGCESKKSWKERIGLLASSCVSSVVWILLMLFDGQYVACAFSSQSGRFVVIDNASRQKLCKADNHNASQELINTQKWYSGSQVRNNLMSLVWFAFRSLWCCAWSRSSYIHSSQALSRQFKEVVGGSGFLSARLFIVLFGP
uniref:Uncharacterized protein n=1 Tax=Seriola dumerili TaxID=41447 RepID=A0A3B4TZM6_SERDU